MTNDNEENFNEEISLQNYKNDDNFFIFIIIVISPTKQNAKKKNYKKIIKIKRTRRDSKC